MFYIYCFYFTYPQHVFAYPRLNTNVQKVLITSLCASLRKHVGGVVLFPTFGLYKRAEETATTVLPLDFEIRNKIILTVSSGYLYYGLEAGEWLGERGAAASGGRVQGTTK